MPHCVLCKIQMPRRRAAALPRPIVHVQSSIFTYLVLRCGDNLCRYNQGAGTLIHAKELYQLTCPS